MPHEIEKVAILRYRFLYVPTRYSMRACHHRVRRTLELVCRCVLGVFVRVGADDARVPIFTVIHPNCLGFLLLYLYVVALAVLHSLLSRGCLYRLYIFARLPRT